MAELVDALDSKSGYRKVVQVRFLFWAQKLLYMRSFFIVQVRPDAIGTCSGHNEKAATLCSCFFILSIT
jgi:hypothetical protein